MPDTYFSKFPIIEYANTSCRDITRNISFGDNIGIAPTLYQPYEVPAGTRADVLAHVYYDQTYLDWMIYHTNKIIDPYYGWYLSEEDFNYHIIEKYGSFRLAENKIKYYQLDPKNGFDITPEYYNNALPFVLRKYYTPNYGYNSKVVSFKRIDESWTAPTNKILKFDITLVGNTQFTSNELVTISNTAGFPVGAAEILSSNSTTIYVKNISGNTSSNNYISGWDSSANSLVTTTTIISEVIMDDEFVFWQPVSLFEYERDINESRKFIHLIDAGATLQISEAVRQKLKQPIQNGSF